MRLLFKFFNFNTHPIPAVYSFSKAKGYYPSQVAPLFIILRSARWCLPVPFAEVTATAEVTAATVRKAAKTAAMGKAAKTAAMGRVTGSTRYAAAR